MIERKESESRPKDSIMRPTHLKHTHATKLLNSKINAIRSSCVSLTMNTIVPWTVTANIGTILKDTAVLLLSKTLKDICIVLKWNKVGLALS